MKIFWSWQSDTPGKTGRFLVRDAIAAAIQKLKQAEDITEPTEQQRRDSLHLDQDRQGLPGSPDLADAIFKKIEEATVVIADVTIVARGGTRKTSTGKSIAGRAFINPNAAIEVGYALKALGTSNILLAINTYYGQTEDLPFDLRHKGISLIYSLAEDAPKNEIDAAREKLIATLVLALRHYINAAATENSTDTLRSRSFFTPDLERIFRRQIQILGRVVPNYTSTSMGRGPCPGDTWTSLMPDKSDLYPQAIMLQDSLTSEVELLSEFYAAVNEVSRILGSWIEMAQPLTDYNSWNLLMHKVQESLNKGELAVQRFCPERQYDATMPAAGTLLHQCQRVLADTDTARAAFWARHNK